MKKFLKKKFTKIYPFLKSIHNTLFPVKIDEVALNNIISITNSRPLDINVEVSSFCSLSCSFCPNKDNRRSKVAMEMKDFEKICNEYFKMGGGAFGLSSMQSDIFSDTHLMQRIELLKLFKSRFWIHTTTVLMGAKKLSDVELLNFLEVFDYIEISFGGPDKDNYQKMFGVNAFEAVIKEIERVTTVVKLNNLKTRIVLAVRTSNRNGFLSSELYRDLSANQQIEQIKIEDKFFSWAGLIKQNQLPNGATLIEQNNQGSRIDCVVPSAELSISADGNVVGCGCVDWNSKHVVGNVFSSSIESVWNSEQAKIFRHGFSRNNIPDMCLKCSLYASIDSGFGKKSLRNFKPTDGLYYTI